jgi:nicotinamidase/pyrazinamidase
MAQNALIIVDVQNDFCPGGALPVSEGHAIVPVINRLVAEFESNGSPIIATRDWHPWRTTHFNTGGGIWPPHCVQSTRGAEFHPDLRLGDALVVSKGMGENADSYSGFDATDASGVYLADLLRARGVERLVVVGLATDYCVKQTVLDGLQKGFAVTVVEDAVRAVDVKPGDAERALEEMARAGAAVRKSTSWAAV